MNEPAQSQSAGRRRFGRAQQDHILDPYEAQHKPTAPTVCEGCGVVYHRGRWQWGGAPHGAAHGRCPACRRTADALPAGIVRLHGEVVLARKDQIIGLARNEEKAEKIEHPLNRIMAIAPVEDGIEIFTTDIHLPRRLGEAVKRAFHGHLDIHFDEAGYFVRVNWRHAK